MGNNTKDETWPRPAAEKIGAGRHKLHVSYGAYNFHKLPVEKKTLVKTENDNRLFCR